jgi:hypothetical protein
VVKPKVRKLHRRLEEFSEERRGKCDVRITSVTLLFRQSGIKV